MKLTKIPKNNEKNSNDSFYNSNIYFINEDNLYNDENNNSFKEENLNFNNRETRRKTIKRVSVFNGMSTDISDIEKLESPLYKVAKVKTINYTFNQKRISKLDLKKDSTLSKTLLL